MLTESALHTRILIVEDDAAVGRLVQTCLERRGLNCCLVRSCERALRYCLTDSYHLLMTDLNVECPRDGLHLLDRIAVLRPSMVRILTSGEVPDDSIRLAMASGVIQQFLQKPWSPSELTLALESRAGVA